MTKIFKINAVNVFSLAYNFLNIFLSLAYFIVKSTVYNTYKMQNVYQQGSQSKTGAADISLLDCRVPVPRTP